MASPFVRPSENNVTLLYLILYLEVRCTCTELFGFTREFRFLLGPAEALRIWARQKNLSAPENLLTKIRLGWISQ